MGNDSVDHNVILQMREHGWASYGGYAGPAGKKF